MAGRSRDVELLIKARDQASAAVKAVTGGLRELSGVQDDAAASSGRANSALGALGAELATLRARLSGISNLRDIGRDIDSLEASIRKLESLPATDRRTKQLAEQRAELARLEAAAAEASQSLGGLEASQESLRAAADQTRDAIRQVSAVLRTQGRAPQEAAPTLGPAAQAASNLRQSIAATNQAREAWRAAQAEATRLGSAIRATVAPTDAQRTAFALARVAAQNAKAAYEAQARASNQLRGSTQGGLAAFEQRAAAIQRDAANMRAAEAAAEAYNRSLIGTVRNLLGLRAPAQQATQAIQQVATASRQAVAAQRAAGASSTSGGALFGLRPHELSNLSFQIQDVVVGLGSGQRPLQVLLQQGSQIAQIGARAVGVFLRLAGAVAAVGAVLAPFIAAFRNMGAIAEDTRRFGALLDASADSARANSAEIARTAQRLDQYGGSLDDARAALRAFLNEGVDSTQFERLGIIAQDMAVVFGVELPDAAQRVAEAFTGNYDDVKRLDDALNFLTQSERAHIRELFESGREADARAEALRVFERQMSDAAQQARGPWSQAFRELTGVWNDLVSAISDSDFAQGASRVLDDLAESARGFARNLRIGFAYLTGGQAGLERLARRVREEAAGPAVTGDPLDTDSERARKAQEDRELAEAERRRQEAERAARSAAQRAAGFHAELRDQIEQREFEASIIGRSAREQAVLSALREAELQARDAGTRVSEAELAALQESILLLEQRREAFETEAAIRESEFALADARRAAAGREVTREEHIANEARQRGIDLTTELGRRFAEVQGEIFDVTQANEQMLESVRRAVELQREHERAVQRWRVAQTDGTPAAAVEVLRERVEQLSAELAEAANNARQIGVELGNADIVERMDATIEAAEQAEHATQEILSAQQANQMIAQGLTGAVMSAADALGQAIDGTLSWGDALRSVADAFRQFAAEFLRQIAQMILQQAILNALSSFGVGGTVAKVVGAVVKHTGGLVTNGPRRSVDASLFAHAPRYHGGGLPGLRANEVAAILKKGEEVLAEDDPRNVLNGGGAQGTRGDIVIHNNIDPADLITAALKTTVGERAVLNWVSANRTAFRTALGN